MFCLINKFHRQYSVWWRKSEQISAVQSN